MDKKTLALLGVVLIAMDADTMDRIKEDYEKNSSNEREV